jgi:hypothetical protein
MKNAGFLDVTPCCSCDNDVSEERVTSIIRLLLVTANIVPRSVILFTLMMEATLSSETSVPT